MKMAAVILAAGKGVRMKSDLPKVSHMICGKPMIAKVLDAVLALRLDQVFVVVGYKAEIVKEECKGYDVTFVEQREQLGTGHAVRQVEPLIPDSTVLVLNGDMPLIRTETLKRLIFLHMSEGASATVLTASTENPHSYGRVVRSGGGRVLKIVEQKDATPEELLITEVNSGTYCFNSKDLFAALDRIKPDNAQREYYLTDVIGIFRERNLPVCAFKAEDPSEILGINTIEELEKLERQLKTRAPLPPQKRMV